MIFSNLWKRFFVHISNVMFYCLAKAQRKQIKIPPQTISINQRKRINWSGKRNRNASQAQTRYFNSIYHDAAWNADKKLRNFKQQILQESLSTVHVREECFSLIYFPSFFLQQVLLKIFQELHGFHSLFSLHECLEIFNHAKHTFKKLHSSERCWEGREMLENSQKYTFCHLSYQHQQLFYYWVHLYSFLLNSNFNWYENKC